MKHLLNDMSQDEMNSIREQHTGGKELTIENFSEMVNKKLGEVPTLVTESELEEQGLGARMRANREARKQSKEANRKYDNWARSKGKILSYNRDFIKRIGKFQEQLKKDYVIGDSLKLSKDSEMFEKYLKSVDDMRKTLQAAEEQIKKLEFDPNK